MSDVKKMIEDAARAINGPHSDVPETSKYTLPQLREVRWGMISRQERGAREYEACAALSSLGVPLETLAALKAGEKVTIDAKLNTALSMSPDALWWGMENKATIEAMADGEWQAVPKEPTHGMDMEGYAVSCEYGVHEARAFDLTEKMHRAMLAAAPS